MPSAEDNAKTVNRYLELRRHGTADDIADMYAEDATVEDPVGGEVHIGRQAIRGFYKNMGGVERRDGVVHAAGRSVTRRHSSGR